MRVILMVALALLPIAAHSVEPAKRLDEAATILSEDMATPDKGVSIDLLAKASCSVVVPGIKNLHLWLAEIMDRAIYRVGIRARLDGLR